MSSFQQREELTLEELRALELIAAETLGADTLLDGLHPPSSNNVPNTGTYQSAAYGVAGNLSGPHAVAGVGTASASYQSSFGVNHTCQLPIQAYSTMHELSVFQQGRNLFVDELKTLESLGIEKPLLNPVPPVYDTTTIPPSKVSGKQPNTSGPDPSCSMSPIASNPDSARAKGDSKGQRILGTRSGAVSNIKKEAQAMYRHRSRRKAQETKAQLQESLKQTQAEIEALKLEQDRLRTHQSVLQGMVEYKDALVARARSAFGTFTSATSAIYSIFGEVQCTAWNSLLRASDEQIYAISESDATIRLINRSFFHLLSSTMMEWGNARPADRERVEGKLGFILNVRSRGVKLCWKVNPVSVARKLYSPPVDLDSLAEFDKAKRCVNNDDLMAAAALTEDQKVVLMKHWNNYLRKYNESRSLVKTSATSLEGSIRATQSGAYPGESIGSLSGAAQGFESAAKTVAALEEFTNEELTAHAELIIGAWDVLRPLQQAVLMFDVTPHVDVVAMYKTLLKLDHVHGGIEHQYKQQTRAVATLCQC